MDVAKSAQVLLEEVLLEKLRYLHDRFPAENLCMAGGVALNVVANSRCLKEGPFKNLFVQPAAGDAGGALGAAAVAHVRVTGEAPERTPMKHSYLGPANDSAAVYRLLKGSSAVFKDCRGREEELIAFTVDRLVQGQVVGWSQGRCEFGPRSLGARSILADPRDPQMRDRINALVKKREWFRPFAPAVLETEAKHHFDLDHPSPFMLETCQVISSLDLPAITHVDGSARLQTVDPETNPRFAALLREFQRRTGCPILLNTSFNGRGEPIVCTPLDAIGCFVRCNLDVLVIEDFILERSIVPPSWDLVGQQSLPGAHSDAEVTHDVYTLL
jgi:carbamoyltransferase